MNKWIAYQGNKQKLHVEFTVQGAPVPQPRPRATKKGQFVQMYMAPKRHPIHEFRSKVEHEAKKAIADKGPVDLPVMVWMMFFCTPPKAMSQKQLNGQCGIMASGGDIDNFAKGVLDAMTKAGMWVDDSRVASMYAGKMYTSSRDVQPFTMVKVFLLGEALAEETKGEGNGREELAPVHVGEGPRRDGGSDIAENVTVSKVRKADERVSKARDM